MCCITSRIIVFLDHPKGQSVLKKLMGWRRHVAIHLRARGVLVPPSVSSVASPDMASEPAEYRTGSRCVRSSSAILDVMAYLCLGSRFVCPSTVWTVGFCMDLRLALLASHLVHVRSSHRWIYIYIYVYVHSCLYVCIFVSCCLHALVLVADVQCQHIPSFAMRLAR